MTAVIFSAAVLLTFKKSISLPLSISVISGTLIGMAYSNYPQIENIVFLLTMPTLVSILIVCTMTSKTKETVKLWILDASSFKLQKFLKIFFLVVAIVEAIALVRWTAFPLVMTSQSSWDWKINLLENNLFYAFGLLSVYFMLFCIISFALKPNITKFFNWVTRNKVTSVETGGSGDLLLPPREEPGKHVAVICTKISSVLESKSRTLLMVFLLAVLPSLALPLYSYVVDMTHAAFLGTDVPEYQHWLDFLSTFKNDPSAYLYQLFTHIDGGSRPLSLLVMYSLSTVSNQTEETILKYLPVILGPFLVVSVYYLVRISYPEKRAPAVIASILTAVSHQIVIGFYAAFYSNWMALIAMSISIAFLLKSLHSPTPKNLVLFGTLTTLTLFFHSYVWSYYVVVVVLFLAWSFVQKKRKKESLKTILILALIVSAIIVVDVTKSHISGASGSFEKDLSNPLTSVGLNQFAEKWKNLNTTFIVYLGGFLTAPAVLLLVFLWTLKANYQNDSDRFYLSLLFVSLLPILFGDFIIQSRMLYNIPFQIPASVMMYRIYSNPQVKFGKPLLVAIILMQFDYALRAMANMYYVAPPT